MVTVGVYGTVVFRESVTKRLSVNGPALLGLAEIEVPPAKKNPWVGEFGTNDRK
jgi:hypothetical protein